MKIQRRIPPTTAPLSWKDLGHGLIGILSAQRSLKRLKAEVKAYFGVRHVFLVSSGKAALTLILLALRSMSPKKEVLIPAYTCFSVTSSIVKADLKVALCDIDPSTLDFEKKSLQKKVHEDTLCVIPNHLFGVPSDMHGLLRLCRERGTYVVEDAAQAMGGTYKGKKLGTLGDVGFFSLGRGKNITCGSGGIIVTNSGLIAAAIEKYYSDLKAPGLFETLKEFFEILLMTVFIHPALFWFPEGLPFLKLGETFFYNDFPMKRLSGMKGGYLKNWQKRLEESNKVRSKTGAYFTEHLGLKALQKTYTPYLRLPVVMKSREIRDKIYSLSRKRGLGLSLMYPTAINEIKEIRTMFNGEVFPFAREIADKLLTIPTHHMLSEKDKKIICELFSSFRSEAVPQDPSLRSQQLA